MSAGLKFLTACATALAGLIAWGLVDVAVRHRRWGR